MMIVKISRKLIILCIWSIEKRVIVKIKVEMMKSIGSFVHGFMYWRLLADSTLQMCVCTRRAVSNSTDGTTSESDNNDKHISVGY